MPFLEITVKTQLAKKLDGVSQIIEVSRFPMGQEEIRQRVYVSSVTELQDCEDTNTIESTMIGGRPKLYTLA